MRIHLTCDCGEQLEAGSDLAGLPTRCPACGTHIEIPGRPAPSPADHTASASGNGVAYDRPPTPAFAGPAWYAAGILLSIGAIAHAGLLVSMHTWDALRAADFPIFQLLADAVALLLAVGLFNRSQAARSSAVAIALITSGIAIVAAFLLPAGDLPAGPLPMVAAAVASPLGWLALLGRRATLGSLVVGVALVVLSWTMATALWLSVRL